MSRNRSTLPPLSYGSMLKSTGRHFSPLSEGMRRRRRCVCRVQPLHKAPLTFFDNQIKDRIRKSVFQGLSDSQRRIRTSCVRMYSATYSPILSRLSTGPHHFRNCFMRLARPIPRLIVLHFGIAIFRISRHGSWSYAPVYRVRSQ